MRKRTRVDQERGDEFYFKVRFRGRDREVTHPLKTSKQTVCPEQTRFRAGFQVSYKNRFGYPYKDYLLTFPPQDIF